MTESRIDGKFCMQRLLILGAGGHGHSVAEAVLAGDMFRLVGFVDDAESELHSVWDLPVFGIAFDLAPYRQHAEVAAVAIGNNTLREELHNRLLVAGFALATVLHPKAMASPSARVGAGSAVMAGAVVGPEAKLGSGVIVNCGAVVDHHCQVEDFGHLGVNAAMAGGSVLGHGAWMQAGVVLGYGAKVAAGIVLQSSQAINTN